MTIKNQYNYGDLVVLKTDTEKALRMIVQINILPNKVIMYGVSYKADTTFHYEFELEMKTEKSIGFNQ